MVYHPGNVVRLLQVALILVSVAGTGLLAQRARSGGHVGATSHRSPSFSSAPRSTTQPGHASFTQNHRHAPYGQHRGGVGYQNRYPYFYPGYPGLLSFGYGIDPEESAPQVAPDDTNEPPVDNFAASNAPSFRPAYQPQGAPAPTQPATTLVFRDGRPSMEVHNYALTGSTLYALDNQQRLEIPLSQLDLPATTEANRKTGVDFALPTSH